MKILGTKEDSPMKRMQGLGILALSLVVLAAASIAFRTEAAGFPGSFAPPQGSGMQGPGGPGMGPGHGPGGPPDPILGMAGMALRGIDLTPTQKVQLRDVLHTARTGELGSLAREFMEARRGLELLVWNPASTEQEIADQGAAVSGASQALDQARRQLAADVLALLTDEQRAEFQENLAREPRPPSDRPEPGR